MTNIQNAKILIVDDEISNVDLLEGILKKNGFKEYKCLTDPRLVLPTYKEWQPDLILLDLMMPHMDGFAVMEALKEIVSADDFMPILVLTADLNVQTKKRTLTSGAMDFVTKPFDVVEVVLRIRNLLHARALHKELQNQNILMEEKVLERTAALHESNARFYRLVSDLNDIVWTASSDGSQIIDVNDSFERIYGFAVNDFKANPKLWLEVVHPDDRHIAEDSGKRLICDGKASAEYRIVKPDGTVRWLLDRKSIIKDSHGNTLHIGGIAKDITERKQAEEALREKDKRVRLATEASGVGIWEWNIKTNIVRWDTQMFNIYGIEPTTDGIVNYCDWSGAVLPEDLPKQETILRNTIQQRGKGIREFRIRRRSDGKERCITAIEMVINDAEGQAEWMLGTNLDITERKQMEEALRENDEQLRLAMAAACAGSWSFNLQTNRTFWTPESIKLYGLSAGDEQIGYEGWLNLIHPNDRERVAQTMGGVLAERRTEFALEFRIFHPQLGERWLMDVGRVSYNTEGNPVQMNGLNMDITKRKQTEEALKKSEEQFRMIAENVADMIAVLDPEGKRIYNSPSYMSILGDPKLLVGTDSFQEIHPEDRERIRQIFQETVKTGIGKRAEYRFLLKDGGVRFIESQGSIIRDHHGNVAQVVVVSRDVTEKKQLEKQALRSQRMESIGTLAGGIAHDLNNVLAPIMLSFDIMSKKFTDEQSQKTLQMLHSTAKRGADLIRQVLSFARGIEGERTIMQVRHLIDEIGKIINETFPKSITLRTDVPKNLPTISADATQLHQVLMNLCVNARDAMPNGGTIEIKAESIMLDEQYTRMHLDAKPGPHLVITVTDRGMGIPPAILERIFEPFFTTKEIGKGTGLGLSTVLAIVKSHDGFVNVYSEVGKGTTFKVYLPAQQTVHVTTEEKKETLPLGNGELIIVVDDEASIREITKTTLEAYGYSVMTASDGTEAVAAYAAHGNTVSLIVTDMMMPYMDGAATIRAIQKMNPTAKFVAVSGLKQNGIDLEQQGVIFLHKPYTSEKLLRTIHEVLCQK